MSTTERNWDEVEVLVRRVANESPELFDPATVANANDVITLMRDDFPAPEVFQGYWPTIRFCWDSEWEIEVFSDRIEVYRFPDRRTDIQYYWHFPGEPFSAELIAALSAQKGKTV